MGTLSYNKIIFRADGNSAIGLGHVIRSLALAHMLKEEFACVFAIQEPADALIGQIEEVCPMISLPACNLDALLLSSELDPYLSGDEMVVLDGYKFPTPYQEHIKQKGCALVCIDDIYDCYFVADVVINHAGGIRRELYRTAPYTKVFLGPQYVLLRPPFLSSSKEESALADSRQLFINMGGADPANHLCSVLTQIISQPYFTQIYVVTGAAYPFEKELAGIMGTYRHVTHYRELDGQQMVEVMKACGTAICPPSSVAFEYASVGGLLFLKQIAENQTAVKAYFLTNGLALDFDADFERILAEKPEGEQHRLYQNQQQVLDGRSDERLRTIFRQLSLESSLSIRRAGANDMLTCFHWANDPGVRSQSFHNEPIPLETHQKWFEKKIADSQTFFYILEANGIPAGQIRFEGDEKEQTISYLIAEEMRGKGLGSVILSKGMEQLLHDIDSIKKISGFVKKTNKASCRAFEKIGFRIAEDAAAAYPDSVKFEIGPFDNEEKINYGRF